LKFPKAKHLFAIGRTHVSQPLVYAEIYASVSGWLGGAVGRRTEELPQVSKFLTASVAEPEEPPGELSRGRFFPVAALLLLTIGTALRLYQLGNRSLWFDEAVTANISRGALTQLLEKIQRVSAPVVHPYILCLVEKVAQSPVAVRAPSVLASLLAVFVMLAMVRVKVGHYAALFSAAILTVSASQIRYAQEVREYSLSVLCAATLIFCFLRGDAAGTRSRNPVFLYAALFLAPLIQYGLVLFSFAILGTIALRLLFARDTSFNLSRLITASAFLAAGGLLSFILTLHGQTKFVSLGGQWYLAPNYFDPKKIGLLRFLSSNSKGLLSFLIPGPVVALCLVIGAPIFCIRQIISRKCGSVTLLLFTSVLVVIGASTARVYPYGGVRQCLFLAPVLTLFAGVVLADVLHRLKGPLQPLAAVGVLVLILLSGYRGLLKQRPYAEYEDTLSVLKELARSSRGLDQVWVNHDAVAAVDFYLQGKDRRFIYGKYHGNTPQEYVPELLGSLDRRTDRFWIVFSHLQQPSDHLEEQLIVSSLGPGWDVKRVIAPTNAALYLAQRRISTLGHCQSARN
jgi:uncharacterized membrane protein